MRAQDDGHEPAGEHVDLQRARIDRNGEPAGTFDDERAVRGGWPQLQRVDLDALGGGRDVRRGRPAQAVSLRQDAIARKPREALHDGAVRFGQPGLDRLPIAAVERGRQVYVSQCTACHAFDASQPGPVGPEVKGASRELLEAKIVRGTYPPGYNPKRPTAVMPPQPALGPEIDALAAYLGR